MEIEIELKDNIHSLMRKIGYCKNRDSYVRPLSRTGYPRFHIYLKGNRLNLHLDQKKPSYKGTSAHSGEYGGKVIEAETERIKKVLQ